MWKKMEIKWGENEGSGKKTLSSHLWTPKGKWEMSSKSFCNSNFIIDIIPNGSFRKATGQGELRHQMNSSTSSPAADSLKDGVQEAGKPFLWPTQALKIRFRMCHHRKEPEKEQIKARKVSAEGGHSQRWQNPKLWLGNPIYQETLGIATGKREFSSFLAGFFFFFLRS